MPEEYQITPKFSYSHYPIDFLRGKLTKVRTSLADVEFDMIAGTGLSGALVIPRIANALGVSWAITRKLEEHSHRERTVEGTFMGRRWLFVDDFILTGTTLKKVRKTLEDFCKDRDIPKPEFAGTYQYKRNIYLPPDHDSILNGWFGTAE